MEWDEGFVEMSGGGEALGEMDDYRWRGSFQEMGGDSRRSCDGVGDEEWR